MFALTMSLFCNLDYIATFWKNHEQPSNLYIYEEGYDISHLVFLGNNSYLVYSNFVDAGIVHETCGFVVASVANATILGEHLKGLLFEVENFTNVRVEYDAWVLVVYFGLEMDTLFEVLWRFRLVNAVVVDCDGQVYTYRPLSEGNCSHVVPVRLVDLRRDSEVLHFEGCHLGVLSQIAAPNVFNTSYGENKGFEVAILGVVLAKLRLDIAFFDVEYLEEGHVWDVDVGGLVLEDGPNEDVLYYLQDEISAFVLPPQPKPPWLNLVGIFDPQTWLGLLATLLVVPIRLGIGKTLSILLGQSTLAPHGCKGAFLLWTSAALILTNAYQGLLVSFLFKVTPQSRNLSFKHIPALRSKIGYTYFLWWSSLEDELPEDEDLLPSNFVDCNFAEDACYTDLIEGRHFLHVASTHTTMYAMSYNLTHVLDKLPDLRVYLVMTLAARSPYVARFRRVLMGLFEGGISDVLDVYAWRQRRLERGPKFKAINVGHLYLIFAVYVFGVTLGCAGFLYEKLRHRELPFVW